MKSKIYITGDDTLMATANARWTHEEKSVGTIFGLVL